MLRLTEIEEPRTFLSLILFTVASIRCWLTNYSTSGILLSTNAQCRSLHQQSISIITCGSGILHNSAHCGAVIRVVIEVYPIQPETKHCLLENTRIHWYVVDSPCETYCLQKCQSLSETIIWIGESQNSLNFSSQVRSFSKFAPLQHQHGFLGWFLSIQLFFKKYTNMRWLW